MKNLLLSTLLICLSALLPAQVSLTVSNPKNPSNSQSATIEDAVLSVRPQGIYWECGLYLTFSARGTTFNATDSLEVVLNFDLPDAAVVHDSWLWIDNNIVRANLIDVWTAKNIYQGAAQHSQGLSILSKLRPTIYQLRIFPMLGDQTRRVKVSFLMPTDWSALNAWTSLPLLALSKSMNTLPSTELLVWPDSVWQHPFILKTSPDFPDIPFTEHQDPQSGKYFSAAIPSTLYDKDVRLAFKAPLTNGSFLTTYGDANEGFYQLALLPKVNDFGQKPKNIAILFNYAPDGGTITLKSIMDIAKSQLLANLRPTDSFNLICSNNPIQRFSEKWRPATPANIEAAFAAVAVTNFSQLGPLIANAVDFCRENGKKGNMLIYSNAAEFSTAQSVDSYIDFITPLLEGLEDVQMHFVEYRNIASPYLYVNGTLYSGNGYLNYRLAQLTNGSLQGVSVPDFYKSMEAGILNCINQPIDYLELAPEVAGGFCYGRYLLNSSEQQYVGKPVLQVGRYYGALPMSVQVTGAFRGDFFYENTDIPLTATIKGDTLLREAWYGKLIQTLEAAPFSNNTSGDILEASLSERVLSNYSAFLCLEDTSLYCHNCQDETQLTETNQAPDADSLLQVFPNPFKEQVAIQIQSSTEVDAGSKVLVEIYRLNGQLMRQFEQTATPDAATEIVWDGTDLSGNEVPAGAYLLTAKTSRWFKTLKLIKQ